MSSSAAARLDACFRAPGLEDLFPPAVRFSAEDSLPEPRSKPAPAIYTFAADALDIGPSGAMAIEDSAPGVEAAVAAGLRTIGNVIFVPPAERAARVRDLERAGAAAVVDSWHAVEDLMHA